MTFAAAAALATGMAFAQTPAPGATPGNAPRGGVRAAMHRHLLQALNLTDAQKQQAKAIFQEARQSAQPIAQKAKDNREALAAAVKANNSSQIQSLATTQGGLQGQLLGIRSEAMAKFYAILTPEQRTKADEVQQQIRQRLQRRLGRGNNG